MGRFEHQLREKAGPAVYQSANYQIIVTDEFVGSKMNINNLNTQDCAAPITGQIVVQVYISDSLQRKGERGG